MRATSLLALLLSPLLFQLSCATAEPEYEDIAYPVLVISETNLEFGNIDPGQSADRSFEIRNEGDMVLGIGTLEIGKGMIGGNGEPNFTLSYDIERMICPEGTGDTATEADATAKASGKAADSGDTATNNGGEDDPPVAEGVLFTLPPGCSIPVIASFSPVNIGQIYGSVLIEAVQATLTEEQDKANELPDYLRDPIRWRQQLYLHGETDEERGILVVRPRQIDFGSINPGEIYGNVRQIDVTNYGDGDIVLGEITVEDTCSPYFDITYSYNAGRVLKPQETGLIEVTFTPMDTDPAFCDIHVLSDDLNTPDVDISMKGNAGTDPANEPPRVSVRSPDPGYRYSGIGDLRMELNVFDVNQPATTLICKVKSALLQQVSVATCTPGDDSGHVFVDIPADILDLPGVDTLLVTVTDSSETTAYASTSILVATEYPEGDDDGDGFDDSTSPPDCDDGNRNTYPEAAEIYDGQDNNCNGLVDEDTIGYDDDGDAFSEVDGDCNDFNRQAYPRGPERGDAVDNDCDGLVDESTSLYDDDGDGYAEVNNDCDDNDPTLAPSATEICDDGIDNDCDGLQDVADNCVKPTSAPIIIGEVHPSQNACLSGERVTLDIMVYDADGQVTSYSWSDDGGNGVASFDNPFAQSVNWTCPELVEGSAGRQYNIYAVGADPDGQSVWSFGNITVYPADYELYEPYTKTTITQSGGCSTVGAASGLLLLSAVSALVRRRRSA